MTRYAATLYVTPEMLESVPTLDVFKPELLERASKYARGGRYIDPATAEVVRLDPDPAFEGAEGFPVNMVALVLTVEAH